MEFQCTAVVDEATLANLVFWAKNSSFQLLWATAPADQVIEERFFSEEPQTYFELGL